jgi:hypothetical protein
VTYIIAHRRPLGGAASTRQFLERAGDLAIRL